MPQDFNDRISLRDRFLSRMEQQKKKDLRLSILLSGAILTTIAAAFLIMRTRTPSLIDRVLAPSVQATCPQVWQDSAVALNSLLTAYLRGILVSYFLWIAVPGCIGLFVLVFVGSRLLARARRRLYQHPAIAEQFLALAETISRIERRWKRMAFGIFLLACCVLACGALTEFYPYLALKTLLLVSVSLFGFMWWTLSKNERDQRGVSTISPAYAKRSCLMGCIQVVYLLVAISMAFLGIHACYCFWRSHELPTHFTRYSSGVSTWNAQVAQLESAGLRPPGEFKAITRRLLATDEQRRASLATSPVVALLKERGVCTDGPAILLLIVGLLLLLTVGNTLWRLEVRRPMRALMLTVFCVVLLEWIADTANSALQRYEIAGYVTRLATTLLIYLAGQVSAFAIRLSSEKTGICPRCSFPVSEGGRCDTCGTLVGKLQAGPLVGNMQSLELHTADCHCAKNLPESRSKTFANAEDAYWEGYDNCGICLKGSDYKWGSGGQ